MLKKEVDNTGDFAIDEPWILKGFFWGGAGRGAWGDIETKKGMCKVRWHSGDDPGSMSKAGASCGNCRNITYSFNPHRSSYTV